jgi:hypothetical protein
MITEGDRPKPPELLSLYAAIPAAFGTLKEEFQVPDTYELVLHHVDAAEPFLRNTLDIAAITMRKIQALRWVAKPGVETTNDIVRGCRPGRRCPHTIGVLEDRDRGGRRILAVPSR